MHNSNRHSEPGMKEHEHVESEHACSFIPVPNPGPEFLWSMSYYSTASNSDAAYFIAGNRNPDVIAEFKNDAWRQLGTLTKGR